MSVIVSTVPCQAYEIETIRQALAGCLEPLGGIRRFVRFGMRVLLKPNMLLGAEPSQAVTTHPLVVQAVAEMVKAAGGEVLIGDSPFGPVNTNPCIWKKTGMAAAAEASGATLALFDSVLWRDIDEVNYFIARPALEADLVINLPKLKTHYLTLYTGAVKNVFGVVPGTRKREVHLRAPGMADFSRELVNLLEIVRPGLTIMDGIVGQEGRGPGTGGVPHAYGLMAASIDPVALDVVLSGAMGFTPGEIVHLKEASERDLGVADPREIRVIGNPALLNFGRLRLPSSPWVRPHLPGWLGQPVEDMIRLQPRLRPEACDGCGKCIRVCPGSQVIEPGRPVQLHLEHCIGCMCCVDACPRGAIAATRGPAARLLGLGV